MGSKKVEGLVLKKYGGFYYVQDEQKNILECKLRGKIKGQVLSGDRVVVSLLEDSRGILEKVLYRDNQLYRPKIANVSMVVIVMANDNPAPSLALLDRLLLLAYYNKITPYILLNKCDLMADEKAILIKEYYPKAGFNLIMTSATRGIGIDLLKEVIKGQIAVFAGPSGTGKSSLLNALSEGLCIRTQEVSNKIGRGRHTTRHVELYPLESGGWVADTPGFSVLDMPPIKSAELTRLYPDFIDFARDCRFSNCIHYKEKDCGIKRAVENGIIGEFRYRNYISMLEEVLENERCYK